MKKETEVTLATLTLHRAPEMRAETRKNIGRWLDKQKRLLMDRPQTLSARYTARYKVTE